MSLDSEKQFLCPRLIDYLAIVGARHSNNPSRQNTSPHIQVSSKPTCLLPMRLYIIDIISTYFQILVVRPQNFFVVILFKIIKTFPCLWIWSISVSLKVVPLSDLEGLPFERHPLLSLLSPTKTRERLDMAFA